MEQCIRISNINDFLYSPQSLYLHSIYEGFEQTHYKADPQIRGTLLHEPIDKGVYSSATRFLQGTPVYSEVFGLVGKIDLYDKEKKMLIERKSHIKHIHEGYRMQLFAQYFALEEGGYPVETLCLHSLTDNKRYVVPLPNAEDTQRLEKILSAMRAYNPLEEKEEGRTHVRCEESIYGTLAF